jgi:tetratricopeptide (TPR) repeat protein
LHGVVLMRAGEPEQALRILGRLRPEGRIRIPLLVSAGEAYYRSGRLAEAERIFRQVADERPRLSIAHRWLAMIYHEMGAMQDSGQEFQEVTRLEPDDFFAYRMIGLLQFKDYANYKEAAEAYRMALARKPPPKHMQLIRVELAEALVRLSDFDSALEVLDAAEEDAAVLGLKAECLWTRGDLAETSRLLERAKALDPDARAVLYLSASIAMEEKKPETALEPLKTLVERDPLDVQASYLLMGAYQRLGDKAAAVAEAERMDEAKASRKKYWDMYTEVMKRPGDAEIRDELAEICDQAGKPDLARIWRRAAEGVRRASGLLVPEP